MYIYICIYHTTTKLQRLYSDFMIAIYHTIFDLDVSNRFVASWMLHQGIF